MENIICFGAGSFLEKYIKVFSNIYNISYICDNDSSKWGKKYTFESLSDVCEIDIISPVQLQKCWGGEIVFVTSTYANEIFLQLKNMGIDRIYVVGGGPEYISFKHQEMLWEYIKRGHKRKRMNAYSDNELRMKHVYRSWSGIFNIGLFTSLVQNLSKTDKIFDYGFGCGTLILNALLLGYDAYGVDIDKDKYEYVMQIIDDMCLPQQWKNHFVLYDGTKICFEDNEFDYVFSRYVLEHVSDCQNSINEMLRVLKTERGKLRLQLPNYDSSFEEHFCIDINKSLRDNKEEFYKIIENLGQSVEFAKELNFINTQDVYEYLDASGYKLKITNLQNKDIALKGTDLLIQKY